MRFQSAARPGGRGCAAAAVVLAAAAGVLAQPIPPPDSLAPPGTPHPIGIRDVWAIERLSDPQPSPDGRSIVYVRQKFDVRANSSTTNLWLVSTVDSTARPLTSLAFKDSNPRWSPDGARVVFVSDRSGTSQIWEIDLRGGEPRQVTRLGVAVLGFALSPGGDRIAFVAETYPECADLDCTKARTARLEADGVAVRRYDRLLFRHWDAWDSGRRRHLFVFDVASGAVRDVWPGSDIDAPPTPFGGVDSYAWSPDGGALVFEGRRRSARAAWTTNVDLFVATLDGNEPRCITEANLATDSHPAWSPDGQAIAYLAMTKPGYEADRNRIVLYDVRRATRRVLTETWDRSPSELVWARTGKALYAGVQDEARRALFRVDAGDGEPRPVPHPGSATSLRVFAAKNGERLAYLGESLREPAEIWISAPDGTGGGRLTATNDPVLASARRSEPQRVWYEGAGGARVHAWLHPPVGAEAGKRYPLLLLVHGGPQGSWDDRFHYRWNPQVFAGAGYAVLAPDVRGSTGYGQAFTDGVNADWGGKPFEDLMRAVDHVVATTPWVDGTRLAAAGGSFGGYMVFWMAGQTDRFRCLVSHAGLFDLESFYGTTEELWFPEWEFGGAPWENRAMYARWDPSQFVSKWKTPMLVIQGSRDYRVPEGQGFAAFTALQRQGIPSELLWFSRENHFVLEAQDSILWYDAVLGWLDRWLASPPPQGAGGPGR